MAKKKRRKYKKWFIYTVLGLIVFVGLFILLKTVPIFVVMEGDKKITLEVHDVYNEPGAYNRFTKKNITPEGTVDTDTLGKYTLTYSSFLQSFKRTVVVVDTTAPQISLNGYSPSDLFGSITASAGGSISVLVSSSPSSKGTSW